jgi:hypothetical protein
VMGVVMYCMSLQSTTHCLSFNDGKLLYLFPTVSWSRFVAVIATACPPLPPPRQWAIISGHVCCSASPIDGTATPLELHVCRKKQSVEADLNSTSCYRCQRADMSHDSNKLIPVS